MTLISVMLAVPDAAEASTWYQEALGATELWSLGSVIDLELHGAPFFLAQPENDRWDTPTTVRRGTTKHSGVHTGRAASSIRSATTG